LAHHISGRPVKNGPKERGADHVFSRMLVEDCSRPKACIRTGSQHRAKVWLHTDEAKSHCVVESLRRGVIRR
jgi:hypothetical protein